MADEILNNESQQENVDNSIDYIEAIKEMKQSSVSRESYDKLKSENKKLIDALVSGKEIDMPKEEKPDINELRKKLFNSNDICSNLEYIENSLKLRKAIMDEGGRDPFLPTGDRVETTAEHYETAEKVATVLQECVDFADGDSGIFTAELQRRTKDAAVLPKKRK